MCSPFDNQVGETTADHFLELAKYRDLINPRKRAFPGRSPFASQTYVWSKASDPRGKRYVSKLMKIAALEPLATEHIAYTGPRYLYLVCSVDATLSILLPSLNSIGDISALPRHAHTLSLRATITPPASWCAVLE